MTKSDNFAASAAKLGESAQSSTPASSSEHSSDGPDRWPTRSSGAWRTGHIEIVISPALVSELAGVLGRPKFAEAARGGCALDYAEALRIGATMVEDPAPEGPLTRDPKDDYFVSPGAPAPRCSSRAIATCASWTAPTLPFSGRALVDQLHHASRQLA